jgi:hypothetical protein
MLTHLQAKTIADAIPGITPNGSFLVRLVGFAESQYGAGFTEHPEANNWGSVTAGPAWKGETFPHEDSRYDEASGKVVPYVTAFRAHVSPAAGAADLWRVLRSDHGRTVAAAERGDWSSVAAELRETKYYLGKKPKPQAIADYDRALRRAARQITRATGEVDPFGGLSRATGMALGSVLGLTGILFVVGSLRTPRRRARAA